MKPDLSIVAQLRDPENYPEFTRLSDVYESIRLYREWAFGRNTMFRKPQKADMRTGRLEEDFSNLGLVLNRLCRKIKFNDMSQDRLRDLYEGLTGFGFEIVGARCRYSSGREISRFPRRAFPTEACATSVSWRSCVIRNRLR